MRLKFFMICYLFASLTTVSNGIAGNDNDKEQQKIPVIDKNKQYPKKSLELETEETFIFLETGKDILLDKDAHICYVSDKRILITNGQKGDVYIFGMNGKLMSRFNQKGGLGYSSLGCTIYDEANKEVFVADQYSRKIVVFTEEGAFVRALRLPETTSVSEIYNFDEKTLLAFHEHNRGELTQKQPYLFLSKKDGSVLSALNITTNKANPRTLATGNVSKGVVYTSMNNYSGSCKFGQDFILFNMSCDTIYHLKQDKTLTPLFVQNPSVFSEPPIITSVGMITDDFIELCIYSYDLNASRRRHERGEGQTYHEAECKFLMYEFKTDRFFELEKRKYWAEKVDIPKNTSVSLLEPWLLKEWLKRGYLEGKIKEVAAKVDIEDNPVIRITKFK